MAKKEAIKSFVLRVDTETMEAIEKWAEDEFRSTNGQSMPMTSFQFCNKTGTTT